MTGSSIESALAVAGIAAGLVSLVSALRLSEPSTDAQDITEKAPEAGTAQKVA